MDDGDGCEEEGEAGGEGGGEAAADEHGGGVQDGQQSEGTNVAAGKKK